MNMRLIDLYNQAQDYFFRGISSKCVNLSNGAIAYMTGIPLADLNPVCITKNISNLDYLLRQSGQFYDQNDVPFSVIFPQDFCTFEEKRVLNTRGYSQTCESVSMGTDLGTLGVEGIVRFDEQTVIKSNDNCLKDWMIPLVRAFDVSFEATSVAADGHKNALKKGINLRHFSLYKQEEPVASITLSMQGTIARIDDVGTLPEFQGRGYATHIVRYVLSEAKRLGAKHCFLESSILGGWVYQKFGFETLFKNSIFSKKG